MKEQILKLRSEGKSYDEIVSIVGCSKSSVAYHSSPSVRKNFREYRNKNRKKSIRDIKSAAGGKCVICGYNKCLTSLCFHHKNPSEKIGAIGNMVYTHSKRDAIQEAKKCVLVCANCHGEIHEGLIKI